MKIEIAMLTESQTDELWHEMVEAEIRSYYYADLGSRYTRWKQIISGASFFLSSTAATSLIAKAPAWVPILSSIITAIISAFTIALNLDKKPAAMAKLHNEWHQIEAERRRIWEHSYDPKAEKWLAAVDKCSREVSQRCVTEAPYNKSVLDKWTKFVHQRHGTVTT